MFRYVRPVLSKDAAGLLQVFYLELRAQHHSSGGAGPPITTRHLEALVRLAQVLSYRIGLQFALINCEIAYAISLPQIAK